MAFVWADVQSGATALSAQINELGAVVEEHDASLEVAAPALTALTSAWVAWSPTLTSLTLGDGAVSARYFLVGKTCTFRFKFKLGSTSAVANGPSFTLPFAPYVGTGGIVALEDLLGSALLLDAGSAQRAGSLRLVSGSTVEFVSYSTTGVVTAISSTVPHTWAVNDTLACFGTYELA